MKQGGSNLASSGFTIVETLIVLAVTGALFVSAVLLISGKQSKTQFTTAINSLQQQLQQIINETASGYYPNNGNFTCVGNATGSQVTFNATSTGQGSNSGCIFLGKAVQFGTGSGDLSSQLGILPIVGNQYALGGVPVLTVSSSRPRAIYPEAGGIGVPDASATDVMQNGLTVAKSAGGSYLMSYTQIGGSVVQAGEIAFIAGDSQQNIASASGGDLASGSQGFSLYGVNGSVPNESLAEASRAIGNNSLVPSQKLEPAARASICIASGSTNQSGLFTIDAGLRVTLQIFGDASC